MELQILYLDTLFFVNLALDLLALLLASLLLHLRRRLWRLLAASCVGAIYAVLAVVFTLHPLIHIILSVLVAVLLVLIAFRDLGNIGRLVGAVLLFYASSVLLGGAIEALFTVLETLLDMRDTAELSASDLVLLLGFAAFGILYAASRFFGGVPLKRFAGIRVTFGGKSATFSVLVDSGCLLSDPISGKPALVVRLDALSTVLPSEIIACARSRSAYMPRDPSNARKCRLIPAEGLGERRLLLSIRPDELCILPEKRSKEKEKSVDAYIALIPAAQNHFGGFEGLLPSSLLTL
jgi:stage II sporulation protein GA (sporulation sigma-E factor processing peptidase)